MYITELDSVWILLTFLQSYHPYFAAYSLTATSQLNNNFEHDGNTLGDMLEHEGISNRRMTSGNN